MTPRIECLPRKLLVGIGARMSLANDATPALWRGLMPRRHEIEGRVSAEYISMRVHDATGLTLAQMFASSTEFEKWAAVEVAHAGSAPEGMASYVIEGGLYAVFIHHGPASAFPETMRYIFGTWLPASDYELDDREQFEVLQEGWDPLDPDAEEEVWVPIRPAGSRSSSSSPK